MIKENLDARVKTPPVPCREIKKCGNNDCPSYKRTDIPCWYLTGTMGHGKVQGIYAQKIGDCHKCGVYQRYSGDETQQLAETFNLMASEIQKREQELKDYSKTLEQKVKERTNELQRAYTELDHIFETSGDGMRVIDKDFNVVKINNAFADLLGISKDETVGKKCYDVFTGELCNTPNCPVTRILKGEKRIELEAEKKRSDGTPIHCIITVTPHLGSEGELIGIVENYKDITNRKRAE